MKESPFANPIKSNETAHWVKPDLVAQVRFTEWTDDSKLRHPVYLGLRDDKRAKSVVREGSGAADEQRLRPERGAGVAPRRDAGGAVSPEAGRASREPASTPDKADKKTVAAAVDPLPHAARRRSAAGTRGRPQGRRDRAARRRQLGVTNLAKLFWPKLKLTKGDLLRYYATVAPLILPVVADRPLVMKRFPNGVDDPSRSTSSASRRSSRRAGVRIEALPDDIDPIDERGAERFIGGSLITLLYMTQLAAISQDPWFSRVQSPLDADYVAIDLDPGEGATFAQVLDVARWVRDELESLKVPGVPKTSGSRGLHIYIPLPPGTSYESGQLFCQIVATVVASKHPKVATVERMVKKRPRGTVYVDFLQNILGKTLATRLQRARERLRRRLDAAHVGRSRQRSRSARLHDRDRAAALSRGWRSVGATAHVKARATRAQSSASIPASLYSSGRRETRQAFRRGGHDAGPPRSGAGCR